MEWISIKKKLPAPGKWCVVYCGAAGYHICQYDSNGNWQPNYGGCCSMTIYWNLQFITHWMILPSRPEKQDN